MIINGPGESLENSIVWILINQDYKCAFKPLIE